MGKSFRMVAISKVVCSMVLSFYGWALNLKADADLQSAGDDLAYPGLELGDAHTLQYIVGKGVHQQGSGLLLGDAPGPQIKECLVVQLSYGTAVGTLHIGRKDLQ